jgi:HK97 family phage major capsid protein
LWAEFQHLSEQAQAESRKRGEPFAETSVALDGLSAQMDRLEAALARQVEPGQLVPAEMGEVKLNGMTYRYERHTAEGARFGKLLRGGMRGMTPAQMSRVKLAELSEQQKAMSVADDTTGGFLAPAEFASDLLRASVEVSPVRQVANVVLSGSGAFFLPVQAAPTAASRVTETGSRTTRLDASFSLEAIPTPELYSTTLVSRANLADGHYPLEQVLTDSAARSFALAEGTEFISGNGVGTMLGLHSATLATANKVTTSGSSSAIADVDLIKLALETVKGAYLPGARFLMNPHTLSKVRQLKATTGNTYLFGAGDGPSTLLGFPVTLAPDLDDSGTTGKVPVYFGDIRQAYTLVVRTDLTVQRLVEKYAEVGEVEFIITERVGGQVVLAEALARLTCA